MFLEKPDDQDNILVNENRDIVIIYFINSNEEVEYTIYKASDGGVITDEGETISDKLKTLQEQI